MPKSSIPRIVKINLEVYNVIPIENIIRKYRNAVFFTIRLLFDEEEFFTIIIFVIFFMDVLLPKIKLKIRLHKELKNKKQKQEAFRKKMKELEIK